MSLVEGLSTVVNLFSSNEGIITDNFVFRLHHVYTVAVLVSFSILMTISQLVGTPMHCVTSSDIDEDSFNSFCWIHGVKTRYEAFKGSLDHIGNTQCDKNECWHHMYYQWVVFVILFQAGCFYFPKFLWDYNEGGKIKSLLNGVDRKTLVRGTGADDKIYSEKVDDIVEFLRDNKGRNDSWSWVFYTCEALNVFNVLLQFQLCDHFLDGQFGRILVEGLQLQEHESSLPLTGSCTFVKYGAGGEKEVHEGLCVLPLNMINQKFYTLFGIWLSFLLLVTAFAVTVRAILVLSPEMRYFSLKYVYGIRKSLGSEGILFIGKRAHGDCFLITRLLQNMSGLPKYEFIRRLEKAYEYIEEEEEDINIEDF